jgi:hypothetical protein
MVVRTRKVKVADGIYTIPIDHKCGFKPLGLVVN